jgi:hypothetical protein
MEISLTACRSRAGQASWRARGARRMPWAGELQSAGEHGMARVRAPVVDVPPIPPILDKTSRAQDHQMLRDGALAEAKHRLKVTDTLLPFAQDAEDAMRDGQRAKTSPVLVGLTAGRRSRPIQFLECDSRGGRRIQYRSHCHAITSAGRGGEPPVLHAQRSLHPDQMLVDRRADLRPATMAVTTMSDL